MTRESKSLTFSDEFVEFMGEDAAQAVRGMVETVESSGHDRSEVLRIALAAIVPIDSVEWREDHESVSWKVTWNGVTYGGRAEIDVPSDDAFERARALVEVHARETLAALVMEEHFPDAHPHETEGG